ncbi:hypothetical protein MARVELLAND_45 [Bacillus phage vB_BspM_MarvelLand]|nr:hypothetical protein MARVELLAND_45 [Bacillus phage vB_BspM_MarvelLand]
MAKWIAYVLFLYFAFTLPIVIPHVLARYKAWRLSKQPYGVRKVESGEIIYRTEEGVYFLAVDEKSIPVGIDEEEGERLWEQGEPI